MRRITYAGETVVTTDDVAEALLLLTAAIANDGRAEAVSIPIVTDTGVREEAGLVIGVGNDVLSAPIAWTGEAPDFSDAAQDLRNHHSYPRRSERDEESEDDQVSGQWDFDLDGFDIN